LRNRQPVGMRGAIQEELRAKLDTLPTAIKSQLISLGMLPFERLA
jgi:hypothetical protein